MNNYLLLIFNFGKIVVLYFYFSFNTSTKKELIVINLTQNIPSALAYITKLTRIRNACHHLQRATKLHEKITYLMELHYQKSTIHILRQNISAGTLTFFHTKQLMVQPAFSKMYSDWHRCYPVILC